MAGAGGWDRRALARPRPVSFTVPVWRVTASCAATAGTPAAESDECICIGVNTVPHCRWCQPGARPRESLPLDDGRRTLRGGTRSVRRAPPGGGAGP